MGRRTKIITEYRRTGWGWRQCWWGCGGDRNKMKGTKYLLCHPSTGKVSKGMAESNGSLLWGILLRLPAG